MSLTEKFAFTTIDVYTKNTIKFYDPCENKKEAGRKQETNILLLTFLKLISACVYDVLSMIFNDIYLITNVYDSIEVRLFC